MDTNKNREWTRTKGLTADERRLTQIRGVSRYGTWRLEVRSFFLHRKPRPRIPQARDLAKSFSPLCSSTSLRSTSYLRKSASICGSFFFFAIFAFFCGYSDFTSESSTPVALQLAPLKVHGKPIAVVGTGQSRARGLLLPAVVLLLSSES